MKKLMITMSAAAMFSLCASAAVPEKGETTSLGTSLGTGVDFTNLTTDKFSTKADDEGEGGKKLWVARVNDDEQKTERKGDSTIESDETQGNYLKIDETEELTRKADADLETAAPIPQAVSVDAGVYFTSKVQFTAADEEPTVGTTDKIIVWAKALESESETKSTLMVTALDDDGEVTHIDTEEEVVPGAWYDLSIVAEKGNAAFPIVFTVKLGEKSFGPYNSMILTGDDKSTVTSVSFKGTGAVDDIDWGTVAAAEPIDVAVNVGADVSLLCPGEEPTPFTEGKVTGVPGTQVVLLAEGAAADYAVEGCTVADGKAEDELEGFAVFTITIAENLTVTINKAGETVYYALTLPTTVENATAVVTLADGSVLSALNQIAAGTVVTVTWTAATGYEITAGATETITMSSNKTAAAPTVTKKEEEKDWDPTATGKAASEYGITGELAKADFGKLSTWAKANNVKFVDAADINVEAFLLNCAPTTDDVAAAKAAFKFTEIVAGTIPTIEGDFNGKVVVLGGTSLEDIASWDAATATDNFYKATLVVDEVESAE